MTKKQSTSARGAGSRNGKKKKPAVKVTRAQLKAAFSIAGSIGGRSRSAKKSNASRNNIQKARLKLQSMRAAQLQSK